MNGRRVGATDDKIFRRGQGGHQREVLIHHANAQRLRVARVADGDLGRRRAGVRPWSASIEAHDALDERRLAGAVLAEQRMKRTGREP